MTTSKQAQRTPLDAYGDPINMEQIVCEHSALVARVAELEAALQTVVAAFPPSGYTSKGLAAAHKAARAALKGQA